MKILFVAPPYPNRVSEYLILPSIELCIMAQILKNNGHTVDLLDMRIDNLEPNKAIESYLTFIPDYVCIDDEPRTHCVTKNIIVLLRKRFGRELKIVIRGEISSFIPYNTMFRNPEIDFIVRYDDDYALLNIIKSNLGVTSLEKIPNIAFRNSYNEIIVTQEELCNYDLDQLPLPFRELYNIEKYLQRDTETIVKSSRGCPSNCLFCIKTKFEHFRVFSVKRFCDEIELLQKFGFSSFFFSDNTFSFSDSRIDDFCNEVIKRGMSIRWTSNMRIKDINEYKLKRMKEAGAYRVFVGIETINKITQKIINKNLEVEMIVEKIDLLKKYELEFHTSFILGNPGDSEEDIEETINFVNRIQPTLATFNLIKVYPGLSLYEHPEKYDIILDDPYWYEKDEWSSKVVMGTKQLPPQLLEKLSRRCLLEFITK